MKMRSFAFALWIAVLTVSAFAQAPRIPTWIEQEKFLRACEDGDLDAVKKYLAVGGSVDVKDKFGQPPMLRVARGRQGLDSDHAVAIADLLLKAGANVDSRNEFGTTALFLTESASGFVSPLRKFLLDHGADPHIKDKFGLESWQRPNFYDHAKLDPSDVAWRLLIEGDLAKRPNDMSTVRPRVDGATFRMAAVYYGDSTLFPATFQWTAEFDKNGESYLDYAAARGKLTGFEFKVVPRSILNKTNSLGETPLIRAAQFDNGELILKLLAAGALSAAKDRAGKTALMYAAEYDEFLSTMNLLTKADPNVRGALGRTALMYAAFHGRKNALAAFVTVKSSILGLEKEARQLPKKRASDLALARNFRRIDVNLQDDSGRTALMLAVTTGNADAVQGVLVMKPNRLLKDKDGKTALDHARALGSKEIERMLTTNR